MVKKTVTYKDFNGNERTEDFYFNLSKAEAAELSLSVNGGYEEMIRKIISTQDSAKIIKAFKDLVTKSYGEKSNDGKYFRKSEQILQDFTSTEAYSQIFMELATDAKKAAEFVNGIMAFNNKQETNTSGLSVVS